MAWTVTVRTSGKVRREEYETLKQAVAALERACREIPRREAVDLRYRTFEPAQQVAGRVEVKGPGAKAGVDVRGDGSAQAWTGRVRRRLVEPEPGEDAYAALRRALRSSVSVEP